MRNLASLIFIILTAYALAACEPVEGELDEPLPDDPMEEPFENTS